ncbi:hypothetical protein [Arthrobacter sp. MDT1-65]
MKESLGRLRKWKHWTVILGSTAILLGVVTVVIFVSGVLQGPTATDPPNAAEWLSAISTVWGAVAAALGALLTGGALLIAALTYQRQVRDRHSELESRRRAQAEAVTVRIIPYKPVAQLSISTPDRVQIEIRNDGALAIFGVAAVVIDRTRIEAGQEYFHSIPPHDFGSFRHPADGVDGAYAIFTDSAGTRWKRWHNGELKEVSHYPKPDE